MEFKNVQKYHEKMRIWVIVNTIFSFLSVAEIL